MSGSSESFEFNCDDLFGPMNAAATALEFAPPAAGAIALAEVVCGFITG